MAGATLDYTFVGLGGHGVEVIVDPLDEWAEFDEGNNSISGGVAVRDCTLPNLFIRSEHINPADPPGTSGLNPDFGSIIESIVITAFNGGNETAFNVDVDVRMDGDLLCSLVIPEVPALTGPSGTVPGSASVECVTSWLVPSELPLIHVIEACLDPEDEIFEPLENDNCATRAIIAGSAPDLWITDDDIIVSSCLPGEGDFVFVTATIRNSGGEPGFARAQVSYVGPDGIGWPIGERWIFVAAAGVTPGESTIQVPWIVPYDTLTTPIVVEVDIVDSTPPEYDETNNHAETVLPCSQPFVRGDCNDDGRLDIGDPIFLLSQLFSSGSLGPCEDACDMNDDGVKNIADPIAGLNFLFSSGPPLPAPRGMCGVDATEDTLGCDGSDACM